MVSDDKMPQLPFPAYVHRAWSGELIEASEMFTADQMHAYARAYAAEQVRELVEALQSAVDAWSGDGPPVVVDTLRALIAKQKGQA